MSSHQEETSELSCEDEKDEMTVITVSHSTWEDYQKSNGVATDLFCTGVIGHPGHMFLN